MMYPFKLNHIHVGSHQVGHASEVSPLCVSEVDEAFELLRMEIGNFQSDLTAECTNHCEQCSEFEFCQECTACYEWIKCEGVLSAIADGDAQYKFRRAGHYGAMLSRSVGPDFMFWVSDGNWEGGTRRNCHLNSYAEF